MMEKIAIFHHTKMAFHVTLEITIFHHLKDSLSADAKNQSRTVGNYIPFNMTENDLGLRDQ